MKNMERRRMEVMDSDMDMHMDMDMDMAIRANRVMDVHSQTLNVQMATNILS